MARRGTFGRLPRSAPSLTSTLIAIAREQEARRDNNIMDAWKNGGLFEGKKVTDEMVLAHWRGRIKDVSKDDPQYDVFNNAILQLEYSIAESKKSVLYSQGKISPQAMASFYLQWAKKVPKNSEFYRVLQRDAAALMRQTKVNNSADAARRKEEAYQKELQGIFNKYEKPNMKVQDMVLQLARNRADIDIGDNGQFGDFDSMDPSVMMTVINEINTEDDGKFLYQDMMTGKRITVADFRAAIAAVDPKVFAGGKLTTEGLNTLAEQGVAGARKRYSLAKKTGHITDMNSAKQDIGYWTEVNRQQDAWPVSKDYAEANAEWEEAKKNASSPLQLSEARAQYLSELKTIVQDPRISNDASTLDMLNAEIEGRVGGDAWSEDFTGLGGRKNDPNGTPSKIEYDVALSGDAALDIENVLKGSMVWVTGSRATGQFVPGVGAEYGAVPKELVNDISPFNMQIAQVPDGTTKGGVIQVLAPVVPVYAQANDPKTGEPLPRTSQKPIGFQTTLNVAGQEQVYFALNKGDNTPGNWRDDEPWITEGVRRIPGNGSAITLDYTNYVSPLDANGEYTDGAMAKATVSGENTVYAFDPMATIDPVVDKLGGVDPIGSYASLTGAVVASNKTNEQVSSIFVNNGSIIVEQIANDAHARQGDTRNADGTWNSRPGEQSRTLDDAMRQLKGLGFTTPGASQWVPTTNADPKAGPVTFVTDGSKSPGFMSGANKGPAVSPTIGVDILNSVVTGTPPNPYSKLKGTPLEPVGAVWGENTSAIAQAKPATQPWSMATNPQNVQSFVSKYISSISSGTTTAVQTNGSTSTVQQPGGNTGTLSSTPQGTSSTPYDNIRHR